MASTLASLIGLASHPTLTPLGITGLSWGGWGSNPRPSDSIRSPSWLDTGRQESRDFKGLAEYSITARRGDVPEWLATWLAFDTHNLTVTEPEPTTTPVPSAPGSRVAAPSISRHPGPTRATSAHHAEVVQGAVDPLPNRVGREAGPLLAGCSTGASKDGVTRSRCWQSGSRMRRCSSPRSGS